LHLNKSSRHFQEIVAFLQLAVSANGLMNGFQLALEAEKFGSQKSMLDR